MMVWRDRHKRNGTVLAVSGRFARGRTAAEIDMEPKQGGDWLWTLGDFGLR